MDVEEFQWPTRLLSRWNSLGWLNNDIQAIASQHFMESTMAWTTPILVEICIGLEINGYLPAEF